MSSNTILSRYMVFGTGVAQLLALQILWIAGVLWGLLIAGFGPASRALFLMLPEVFRPQPNGTWRTFLAHYWYFYRQERLHWSIVGVTQILHGALIIGGIYLGVTHEIFPRFLALAILIYWAINSNFLWYIAHVRKVTWTQSLIIPFMWAVANPRVLISTTVLLAVFWFLMWLVLPLAILMAVSGSAAIVWRLSQGAAVPAA